MSTVTAAGRETTPQGHTRRRRREWSVARNLGVLAIVLWCAFNVGMLVWVVLSSFRGGGAIFSTPFALPDSLSPGNYLNAWSSSGLGTGFVNSVVLVSVSATVTVVLAALAAYALSRTAVPSASPMTSFFALGLGIPMQVVILPVWVVMNKISSAMYAAFGWWDERISLFLLYVAISLPFAVFLLTAFFRTLPAELEEAAALDGASSWQTFRRVMLPLARPGLSTALMLTGLSLWNETLLALVFLSDNAKYTLPQSLLGLYGTMQYTSNWGGLFAGIVIVVVPTLIAYLVLGRRLVEGMTLGAGK